MTSWKPPFLLASKVLYICICVMLLLVTKTIYCFLLSSFIPTKIGRNQRSRLCFMDGLLNVTPCDKMSCSSVHVTAQCRVLLRSAKFHHFNNIRQGNLRNLSIIFSFLIIMIIYPTFNFSTLKFQKFCKHNIRMLQCIKYNIYM